MTERVGITDQRQASLSPTLPSASGGCVAFLRKPFSAAALTEALAKAIE
jgi:CheY-like chemotaxis protein